MRFITQSAIIGVCLFSSAAAADIAYDNLTGQPYNGGLVFGQTEVAQQIRLAPGAGLTLTELSIEFRNATANAGDAGQITMALYSDAGNTPGQILASETFAFQLDRLTTRTYSIVIDEVEAPSRRLWAAWYVQTGSRTGVNFGGEPLVGSTSNRYVSRLHGLGGWTDQGHWHRDPFHIRVTTVPGPGVLVVAAAGFIGCRRRTRG